MEDLEIKNLRKVDGEIISVRKISLKAVRERKEICKGQMMTIQIKLDNLEYQKKTLQKEIDDIDDLLRRKDDYKKEDQNID